MSTTLLGMSAERCKAARMDDSQEKIDHADTFESVLRRWFPQVGQPEGDVR